jgi:hypothetical protein
LDEGSTASFFESIDVNSSAIFRDTFVIVLNCWRVPYDISKEDCFRAVEGPIRRPERGGE